MWSFASVLVAVLLLEVGSGLQGVLLPVKAEVAGFSSAAIGLLGSAYYLGFTMGCVGLSGTVRRVGHIRSYSALAALGAAAVLFHPMFAEPVIWFALRFVLGLCFAGLFMVVESWLNSDAGSGQRGQVLALYMMATWLGLIAGKLLFSLEIFPAFQPFSVVAAAVAMSVVPISLTRNVPPAISTRAVPLKTLMAKAPLGVLGCLGTGLANGAFWTFAPVFALQEHRDPLMVSLFMSACVAGGALGQWPVGRISDRFDRRWTLLALCAAATVGGAILASEPHRLFASGAFFGAAALPLYAVFSAHANDKADSDDYVEMSGLLLLAFGAGALVGPLLMGLTMTRFPPASLFAYTGVIHVLLLVAVAYDLARSEAVAKEERATFASHPPVSHATQVVAELQVGAGAAADMHQR